MLSKIIIWLSPYGLFSLDRHAGGSFVTAVASVLFCSVYPSGYWFFRKCNYITKLIVYLCFFKSYLSYTSQLFLSCKYKRIKPHYCLVNNCNLITSYNWDFCLQKHLTLTTCSLQQQYENKPINSRKPFKRRRKKKSTAYGSISAPYRARSYLHHWDVYHCVQKNQAKTPTWKRGFGMVFVLNIQTNLSIWHKIWYLLYSKCLDTTTVQDRTGFSQEQKEVIAVLIFLMGGYRWRQTFLRV